MKKLILAIIFIIMAASTCLAISEIETLNLSMRNSFDEIEGINWIHDQATPTFGENEKACYLYIRQEEECVFCNFVLGYESEEWLFITEILINTDGVREKINLKQNNVYNGKLDYFVWEQVNVDVETHMELVQRIINSKKTLVRLSGKNYNSLDFEISAIQKKAMERVLRLYSLM